jgi:hypothetical protein
VQRLPLPPQEKLEMGAQRERPGESLLLVAAHIGNSMVLEGGGWSWWGKMEVWGSGGGALFYWQVADLILKILVWG